MNWSRSLRTITSRVFGAVGGRTFALIAGVTVVLTAALIGVVGLVTGQTAGTSDRFPYYVLLTAIGFVTSLWKLEDEETDGSTVLIAASGIALGSGLLVSLAIEGVVSAMQHPDRIFNSQLIVYFLAAGVICTGLGMWCLRHWREFTVYD